MPDLRNITNRQEWNDALRLLPNAHVLQSWEWGEFKSRWGWTVERLCWRDQEKPVAAAQVLGRTIPRTPWKFLYISKGPVLDFSDNALVERVLTDLETHTKKKQGLFIKIDPDVVRQFGEPRPDQPVESSGMAVVNLLDRRGWRLSPEQIQFQSTVVIDLKPDLTELLAGMKSKWRYNIRLAERKGVTIRPGTVADIETFFTMYAETAARDGFLIRPENYYRDVWQLFLGTGQAEMLLASADEQVVAGLIVFIFGQTAWYMNGASTGEYRKLMPNHALQWAAICRAKERGCLCYDMWGAPDIFNESDRLWGVYRFKQGFGGQVVQWIGAYDYPANRPLYWTFSKAMPQLRTLLRRLKHPQKQ